MTTRGQRCYGSLSMTSVLLFGLPILCLGFTSPVDRRVVFPWPSHRSALINPSDLQTVPLSEEDDNVDVAIVGAGIGGLCAGAILNTLYGKKVGVYESHYLAGGCAHAFEVKKKGVPGGGFTFDSGPTIVLGCSRAPFNPLRQVLNAVGESVEWIRYDGWGMVEQGEHGIGDTNGDKRWRVELGPGLFERGPLTKYGGPDAVTQFRELSEATKPLVAGAVGIPAMAGRSDGFVLLPLLLRHFKALSSLLAQGSVVTGTFAPFMDGPLYEVKDPWLRDWLDALAFSLSGLPANRTAASAMSYVLYDMHREGAALDYPQGGLGSVVDALVRAVERGDRKSKVRLRSPVGSIDTTKDGTQVIGLTLKNGKRVNVNDGVICNAPMWSVRNLLGNEEAKKVMNGGKPIGTDPLPRQSWGIASNGKNAIKSDRPEITPASLLSKCDTAEMTGSFLHLHLALNSTGLDLDAMEAHYTVMARGLSGITNDSIDGPCGELNMIAVSNPCKIDPTLAPEGFIVVHAYGAGNEPYDIWTNKTSNEYLSLKKQRSDVLWEAVTSVIPDVRDRVVLDLVGSPLTHERFLRRPRGTYGAATEDLLQDGSTPIAGLVLCGDGIFPGIGIPAVAYNGASAANAMVDPLKHWRCLDELKSKGLI